ncbi:glycosyltransferase family 2 protein [Ectothiorhodospiraceae bacterium BW-2]|nr:glycosyltransferase family 2 protein [Ectothiorhodospiraceae bacterium BW-2]
MKNDFLSFSVFMSNYNQGSFIEEALDAILAQELLPNRIVLVNDGSTDGSDEIMRRYTKQSDYAFDFINLSRNRGPFNIDIGLQVMDTDYFIHVCPDDPVRPHMFEAAMDLLSRYPRAGICFSDATRRLPNGESSEVKHYLSEQPRWFSSDDFADAIDKQPRFSIATSTSFLAREHFDAAWNAHPNIRKLRWHYDWFLYFVMAFRYGVCYSPKSYQFVRINPNSYSMAGSQSDGQEDVLRTMLALLELPEFADVKPYFRIPAVFARFGSQMIELMRETPAYHYYLSDRLIEFAQRADEYNAQRHQQFSQACS